MNRLEQAIAGAARHYAAAGRAELDKQATPRAFGGLFVAQAPLDFKGWFRDERGERPPCVIEAKECKVTSVPFDAFHIKQHQVEAIAKRVADGIQSWLIIDMTTYDEVFRVDGKDLVAFTSAPWRSSLSIDWLRAFGEICKVERGEKPRVWFLDTKPSPLRSEAGIAVAKEKALAEGRTVELYPASKMNQGARANELRDLLARKPRRDATDAEHVKWCDDMSRLMLERDIREAKKRQNTTSRTYGRKKGWAK